MTATSELRDALTEWDSLDMDGGLYPESVLVDAARRLANLDYEAAAKAIYEFHLERIVAVWEANDKMIILDEWADLSEEYRKRAAAKIRIAVNSALHIDPSEEE